MRRPEGRTVPMMMAACDTTGSSGAPRHALSRRDLAVVLIAAGALQALAWAVLLALFSGGLMGYGLHDLADTLLYQQYAVAFSFGRWPYSGVPIEYPPLANLLFLLAPARASVATYETCFTVAMLVATSGAAVLTTAAAALSRRLLKDGVIAAVAYAVLTLCCGALAANRYDAVVALVVAAALLLLVLRRGTPAAAALGIGFALKLTPALLLPLALIVQESRKRLILAALAFVAAAALPFVPFALHDAGSVTFPFTYHADRPLQIESVLATPWTATALLGIAHPRVISTYGSQNFAGAAADVVAALSPWLMALCVGLVYLLIWRRRGALRSSPGLIPVAALAVLLVAICTSKVLSPQFLIWTFPVVTLCVAQPRRLPRAAALAVVLATALTQLEFPARYWDVVALDAGPLAIVVARNAVLVIAAVLAVVATATLVVRGPATAPTPPAQTPSTSTS